MMDSEKLAFLLQLEEFKNAATQLGRARQRAEAASFYAPPVTPTLPDLSQLKLDIQTLEKSMEEHSPKLSTARSDKEEIDNPFVFQEALFLSYDNQRRDKAQQVDNQLMREQLEDECLDNQLMREQLEDVFLENQLMREQLDGELLAQRIEDENADRVLHQHFYLFYAEARDDRGYVGLGCVMKDEEGSVVFQNRECIGFEVSHHVAEYTALINGLAYARSTGVRHVTAYGNSAFVYCEYTGRAEVKTSEQAELLYKLQAQVQGLLSFNLDCVSIAENADAINLAKYAIDVHVAELARKQSSNVVRRLKEKEEENRRDCVICLEKVFASDIACQKACAHEFCVNCLSQHVENEVLAGKVPVRCPQFFACHSTMELDDCQHFLSLKACENYATRLTEATISDAEKVYCPFPNCSAMMFRNEGSASSRGVTSASASMERSPIGGAECMECHRLFCVECQVPWHGNLSCREYQRLPPGERDAEDLKFFQLAKDQNWRRCKKCRTMILLSAGCFHMTCRCGNEFCYTCETEYKNKKKMCKCPLFHNPLSRLRI